MGPDRRKPARRSASRLAAPVAVIAAWLGAGAAARAQTAGLPDAAAGTGGITNPLGASPTVLPQIGNTVPSSSSLQPNYSAGSLHDQVEQAVLGNGTPQQPGWTFSPSIGVTQEYDTGSGGSGSGNGSTFVTSIQPFIAVTGQTSRVQANLNYAPIVRLYEGGGSSSGSNNNINNESRVSQNFNGRVLGTLVPGTLFLDLRGNAAEQSRFGGTNSTNTTTLGDNDATQNYSFSVSPYLVHRFGTTGTGEIGYSFARTLQDSSDLNASNTNNNAALAEALNTIGNQNVTTQNFHLAFETGEDFGRYNGAGLVSSTYYDGTGVLSNAHRNILSIDNGYAITRTITALARVGYEDIHYAGTSPVNIKDEIWDAGVRLTLDPTSSLTVRYGHHDGFNSLFVSGNAAPTARTRVYVQYSAGLTTQLENLQNGLATSDLDGLGNPVDHTTGIPLYLSNNLFGTQAGLYKLKRFSVGGQLLLDHDVVSVSIDYDDQILISSPSAAATSLGVVSSSNGTTGIISWSHEFTPQLSTIASFQYGVRDSGASAISNSRGNTILGSLSTNYLFSQTLTGTALYSYSKNDDLGNFAGNSDNGDNRFLVGLRKSF